MAKPCDDKGRINARLRILDCGSTDFRETLSLQRTLVEQKRSGKIPNTVLIVEHRPVITLGARESKNKLLVESEVLAQRGVDLV